jgi:hypothetical protein
MNGPDNRMTIVDLRIPYFRLVFFIVKTVLAMALAALILSMVLAVFLVILHTVSRMLGGGSFEAVLRQLGM